MGYLPACKDVELGQNPDDNNMSNVVATSSPHLHENLGKNTSKRPLNKKINILLTIVSILNVNTKTF